MNFPLAVVLLLSTLVAGEDEETSAVARKCCPAAAFDCCVEVVQFNLRLSCEEIASDEERRQAMVCIQQELHGAKDIKKTSIKHLDCCDAFHNDFTDPHNRCHETCKYALRAPSLSAKSKLHLIRECRRKNDLLQCFNQCRAQQAELEEKGLPVPSYKSMETDECASKRMLPDEYIPVKQIMRRF